MVYLGMLLAYMRRVDQRIMPMVTPVSINLCKGATGAFILEGESLNKPYGGCIVRHNISINSMYLTFIKQKINTFLNAFCSIALVQISLAEFVSKATAVIRIL